VTSRVIVFVVAASFHASAIAIPWGKIFGTTKKGVDEAATASSKGVDEFPYVTEQMIREGNLKIPVGPEDPIDPSSIGDSTWIKAEIASKAVRQAVQCKGDFRYVAADHVSAHIEPNVDSQIVGYLNKGDALCIKEVIPFWGRFDSLWIETKWLSIDRHVWSRVLTTHGHVSVFYDKYSVEKEGEIYRLNMLWSSGEKFKDGTQSRLMQQEIDCSEKISSRTLSYINYSDAMANGEVMNSHSDPSEWIQLREKSVLGVVASRLCADFK